MSTECIREVCLRRGTLDVLIGRGQNAYINVLDGKYVVEYFPVYAGEDESPKWDLEIYKVDWTRAVPPLPSKFGRYDDLLIRQDDNQSVLDKLNADESFNALLRQIRQVMGYKD